MDCTNPSFPGYRSLLVSAGTLSCLVLLLLGLPVSAQVQLPANNLNVLTVPLGAQEQSITSPASPSSTPSTSNPSTTPSTQTIPPSQSVSPVDTMNVTPLDAGPVPPYKPESLLDAEDGQFAPDSTQKTPQKVNAGSLSDRVDASSKVDAAGKSGLMDLNKNVPLTKRPIRSLEPSILPETITLQGEPTAEVISSLVNTVLSASVVKHQEYPIQLETVLKLVEAQNLPIQREQLNAKLQNTAFLRTLSEMLPDINGTYSQSRFQGAIQIFGSTTVTIFQSRIVPQLQATWLIKPGGQDVFNALAARRRYKESKFRLDSTLQEQLAEATRAYYDFLEARVQVENIQVGLSEARTQTALNEARWKAGVGTQLDMMRAKTQQTQKETELVSAENSVALAEQRLLNILNLDPDVSLVATVSTVQPKVLVPLSIKTNELVARAVASNPSLLAEMMALKAISASSKATLSRVVPSITLQTYINGTGPQIDQLGLSRFGGFVIQSNLFDGLGTAIPIDYRARRLEYKRQEVVIQERLRNIQSQVIDAFLDSKASAQRMLTAQVELDTAQEAYRLSVGRFRAGLGINVDVLNAQTALTLARVRITNAILSYNRAQASLLQAIGAASTDTLLNGLKLTPSSSSNRPTGKKSSP